MWATGKSDIIISIVPTPVDEFKDPDLTPIISSVGEIAKGLSKGKLVVLESTVYPGVTEETLKPLLEKYGLKAGVYFGLAYCPERYNPSDGEHSIEKGARVVTEVANTKGNLIFIILALVWRALSSYGSTLSC